MADTKPAPKSDSQAKTASDEVQKKFDEDLAQGYRGVTQDPNPNSAYSLQSGPDSPPLATDTTTRFEQPGMPAAPAKEKK